MEKEMFSTQSGKILISLSLEMDLFEKELLKEANSEQIILYYSTIHQSIEKFKNELFGTFKQKKKDD